MLVAWREGSQFLFVGLSDWLVGWSTTTEQARFIDFSASFGLSLTILTVTNTFEYVLPLIIKETFPV